AMRWVLYRPPWSCVPESACSARSGRREWPEAATSAAPPSRLDLREEALQRALTGEGHGAVTIRPTGVVALQRQDERDAHNSPGCDVGCLELVPVAIVDLPPGGGEAVHGNGKVVPVEAFGNLRIAEENEAEKGEHLLEGGAELT